MRHEGVDRASDHGKEQLDSRAPGKSRPNEQERLQRLSSIANAANQVVRNLERDEALRSEIVKEEESEDSYSYTFRVTPNPDFEGLVDHLIEGQATKMGIDGKSIALAIKDKVEEFNIPDGMERAIMIRVPKNSGQEIHCLSGLQPHAQGMDESGNLSLSGLTIAFSVPQDTVRWRYQHLLDLDGKE